MRPPLVPRGEGLVHRRLRIAESDVVRLGAVLAGYDHLAQIHQDHDGTVVLVTTTAMADALDAVLTAMHEDVLFEVVE